jgi:hypothetical protein
MRISTKMKKVLKEKDWVKLSPKEFKKLRDERKKKNRVKILPVIKTEKKINRKKNPELRRKRNWILYHRVSPVTGKLKSMYFDTDGIQKTKKKYHKKYDDIIYRANYLNNKGVYPE